MFRKKNLDNTKKRKSREKGQSLVEFAVSLVILLIILSGVIDLGRLFFYYIAMRDAAQEGVVYAIVNPSHCSQILDRTLGILSNPDVDVIFTVNGADYDCSDSTNACAGNTFEVEVVDENFPIAMPFLPIFLGRDTLELHANVSGTILRPQCAGE